ncbi:hypothetical protein DID88_001477 [Monilinia fructigena]|uniref:Sterol 24-C-methyltransferase n=1 Tax=Monilinia fructigena TaxID=38457 RepID=A0A395IX81_9HELO|nr:hypothetical protein DID88_001477 [Monilinia fructigena]
MLLSNKAMHKDSSNAEGRAVDEYFKHWDNKTAKDETKEDRDARVAEYATLTRHYYNLATDLYEYGWGQSFHFCRFAYGEPFYQAIARHEHYLAAKIGIKDGDKVLDVGCGVGGPAREIAKFTGAHITGLNNNMITKLSFVKGDFMQMSFPANSFDAVYAIEATVHAPSLEGVYSQIFNVLKPGGTFGVYEWLMTDNYDNDNEHHRHIRLGIEQGDGISNMVKISEGIAAIKAAGFELVHHEDLAKRPDATPWYYPLAGEFKHMGTIGDFFTIAPPQGTQKTADSLALAADCLVDGAKEDLFTPMYLMVARKPLA